MGSGQLDLRAVLALRPEVAAPQLLGSYIVCGDGHLADVVVELTEVEAYGGADDPGSHARIGRTLRNASMFAEPGTAYVYFTYGMHWCLNVACSPAGEGAAVLLRAGRVVAGVEAARGRRASPSGKVPRDRDLARGPARLTTALGVDRRFDGVDLLATGRLRLVPGRPTSASSVASGPRVGVAGAGAATPWRFSVRDDDTVSAYRPGRTKPPG